MNLVLDVPVWINLGTAAFTAGLTAFLFGREPERGIRFLRLLMACLTWWAFVNAFELAVTDIPLKIILSKVTYLGIITSVPTWLAFSQAYRGAGKPFNRILYYGVLTVSLLMLAAVFTNEWHHGVWTSIMPDPAAEGNRLIYSHGSILYAYAAVAYGLMVYGTVIASRGALADHGLRRWQSMLLVVAAVFPLTGNIIYIARLTPWASIDFTPLLFGFTGLAFTIGIFRFRMFDLLPVARDRLFDNLQDAVIIVDRFGRVVDINSTARMWFLQGVDDGSWQGGDPAVLFPALEPVLRGGECSGNEIMSETHHTPDGRWLEVRSTPLTGRRNEHEGVMCTLHDITVRIETEMKLQHETLLVAEQRAVAEEARRAADAANEAKSTFLTNMSHEMRTPLIAITGFLPLLEESGLQREQQRYAREIGTASEALLDLVNEMLDLSRIEAGRMELEQVPFRLDELLAECASMVSVRLLGKPVDLTVEIGTAAVLVKGDRARVRQMFLNLAANAAKFTESGSITLRLRDVPDSDGSSTGGRSDRAGAREQGLPTCRVALDVTDTGPGIAEDVQPRLFEPFTQASGDTARKYGGSGLGLAITRRIAEAMGGSITLESWPGLGSTFTLTLSFLTQPLPQHEKVRRERWYVVHQGQRIDTDPQGDSERYLLHAPVGRGAAGGAFEETGTSQMGREAVMKTVKWMDAPAEAVSGDSMPQDGDSGWMAEQHPRNGARSTVASEPVGAEAENNAGQGALQGCHAMVVEDTLANRNLLKVLLERMGCRVTMAENGLEAVDLYGTEHPDLILMDIQMPVMDGMEATRFIRTLETVGAHVPIIAMTANAMHGEREASLAAGMDDFMTKPVKPQLLEESMIRWFRKSRA